MTDAGRQLSVYRDIVEKNARDLRWCFAAPGMFHPEIVRIWAIAGGGRWERCQLSVIAPVRPMSVR